MNPINWISKSGFNDLKESLHCHNLIMPFRDPAINVIKIIIVFNTNKSYNIFRGTHLIPDATRSVLSNVAILEIHIGWLLVSSFPCASRIEHKGFFFKQLQTHNCPSSPQLKKFSSFMSFTVSMLPLCPPNISCDSSTIFQIRIVPSKPPLVIARSRANASIDVIPLWCPNLIKRWNNIFTIFYSELH